MNQDYKLKFDQMRENQTTGPALETNDRLYPNAGYSRRVGFMQLNGRKKSFNYAYLVSHDYDPDESILLLEFTTHTVKLVGYNLETLFFELFDERNRLIECVDDRYEALQDNESIVVEITIKKNS